MTPEKLEVHVKAQVERFKRSHIPHPHHQRALEELDSLALCPGSTSIVQFYGPSGAGKSTLIRKFEERLIERAQSAMMNDPAHIPYIRVNAPAIQRGSFHFRELFKRMLRAADEPCIQYKQLPPRETVPGHSKPLLTRITSNGDVRLAVERCFQYRSIPLVIIDDAMHIAKVLEDRMLINNVDVLKDLAKETGALIVLVGTSEVLPLVDLSAQNIRLSWDIEYPHYDWRNESERKDFCHTLVALLRYMDTMMPVPKELFEAYWEEFYSGSLGCIGVLKDWLTRALKLALREHATTLSRSHCVRTRWSTQQLTKMAEELLEGAIAMAERRRGRADLQPDQLPENTGQSSSDTAELRRLLGMETASTSGGEAKDSKLAKPKKRRRPGKRNPTRDQVGHPPSVPPEAA